MPEPIRILLVDDEKRNLDALEAILDDDAYRLLRAEDADRALKLLLENDVAAIVLDIKMPGISGFELAQLIKGTKKFRQIPIVFLTAHLVDDSDVIAGYGAGAVDYLTKPVNPQILRHKVSVFADLFRKTRALAELNENLERRVQERTADLEASETALRAASHQKDLFLATLAHELRNPLAPLRTGLDLLLTQVQRTTEGDRTLATMNRQLDHMVRLVDDLLDVSRISRGMLEVRKAPANLRDVLQTAMETSAPLLERHAKRVTIDAPDSVRCLVDAARVAQVVSNLLNNAAKHSASADDIELSLRVEGDRAVVRVVDHGVGIPADQMGRVFEMFTRIERSTPNVNDGLGIGLALSRQIAELHGGDLTATSEGEGRGSVFTLTLPLDSVRTSLPPAPPSADDASTSSPEPLRIALIEDNEDAADTLAAWLELHGHRVTIARTGPDGVALVLREQPDVVLCDLGLPGMDGVEVCRAIVARTTHPPVLVALTGWGMDSDRDRTRAAGFAHHLVKPVLPNELTKLLRTVRPVAPAAKLRSP